MNNTIRHLSNGDFEVVYDDKTVASNMRQQASRLREILHHFSTTQQKVFSAQADELDQQAAALEA